MDTAGIITTIAGTGLTGYNGDGGPASAANFFTNGEIAIDRFGCLYIADIGNFRIRKINTAGIISTVAGNGTQGFSGDGGPATSAQLYNANGVFIDNCNNIYISDIWNNRIRVVNGSGIITTIAGKGTQGFSGDGGPATAAELNRPGIIYLDKYGSIYIQDALNYRVRYIHMDSCINTAASVPLSPMTGNELHVLPNPNNGTFSIMLSTAIDEPAEIVITNIVGAVVQEVTTTTNKETEVKLDVPAGMYFITAGTREGRYNTKVVVTK